MTIWVAIVIICIDGTMQRQQKIQHSKMTLAFEIVNALLQGPHGHFLTQTGLLPMEDGAQFATIQNTNSVEHYGKSNLFDK